MKMITAMFCAGVLVGVSTGCAWADHPLMEKLPFEKATITYTLDGMEQGEETVYVDDFGRKKATYHKTTSKMMGMTVHNQRVEISDGEWDYSFDLVEGIGMKSHSPLYFLREQFDQLSAKEQQQVIENRKLLGMSAVLGAGGTIEENAAELLGYTCDKAEMMGSVVYTIHGSSLPLKTEADMMGMKMTSIATAIEPDKVDDQYFNLPQGIEPVYNTQSDAMGREMARQTIDWLKDPEASAKPMNMGTINQDRMHALPEGEQAEMMLEMEQIEAMMKTMQGQ